MATPKRQQVLDRLSESAFVRDVVGPKIIEPITHWYSDQVVIDQPTDALDPAGLSDGEIDLRSPEAAGSLASAQRAEAFLAGDAQEAPVARPLSVEPEEPAAPVPAVGGVAGAREIFDRVRARIKSHNLNVVAAGIAFWGLLAIPAILTAVVSIYGLVSEPEDVEQQINDLLSGASEGAREVIGDQLEAITGASGGGLAVGAVVGILLALWTSSGAVAKLIATLNTIWGVEEDRKFPKLRGLAVLFTVGSIAFIAAAAFLLAVLPPLLGETSIGDAGRWVVNIARFPAMLVFMAVGLSVMYWLGPNVSRRLRLLSWGAVWATVLWLVLSGLFTVYTSTFASYNETFGTLGALVVLLLWLFITAFMVLVGAEIEAAREQRDADVAAAAETRRR